MSKGEAGRGAIFPAVPAELPSLAGSPVQPRGDRTRFSNFAPLRYFRQAEEQRDARVCRSFGSFSISIRVPKPDVQSGLAIFARTDLPSGSIREIIVLPAGKIKERHKPGPERSRIDVPISRGFGPGGRGRGDNESPVAGKRRVEIPPSPGRARRRRPPPYLAAPPPMPRRGAPGRGRRGPVTAAGRAASRCPAGPHRASARSQGQRRRATGRSAAAGTARRCGPRSRGRRGPPSPTTSSTSWSAASSGRST